MLSGIAFGKLKLTDQGLRSLKKLTQSKIKFTVKSRAKARVTIQKIKSLGVLQIETCHYPRHASIHKFKIFGF